MGAFATGTIDVLNKHFQNSLHISKAESGFVQFANFIGYFCMAIPPGLLAKRFGYKGGILIGLALIASGAFFFIPATYVGTFAAFLTCPGHAQAATGALAFHARGWRAIFLRGGADWRLFFHFVHVLPCFPCKGLNLVAT